MKEPSQITPSSQQLKSELPFPQATAVFSFFILGCSKRHTLTPPPGESSHWTTETSSLLTVLGLNCNFYSLVPVNTFTRHFCDLFDDFLSIITPPGELPNPLCDHLDPWFLISLLDLIYLSIPNYEHRAWHLFFPPQMLAEQSLRNLSHSDLQASNSNFYSLSLRPLNYSSTDHSWRKVKLVGSSLYQEWRTRSVGISRSDEFNPKGTLSGKARVFLWVKVVMGEERNEE